jgi:acetoin utilization deacetylase AcuC-like enzyme
VRIFYSPKQLAHRPVQFMMAGRLVEHLEVPDRCERLLAALRAASYIVETPREAGGADEVIGRIHSPGYLEFLRTAWDRWTALKNAGPEMLPNVHPYREAGEDFSPRPPPRAESPIAHAGHYLGDLASAIAAGTWESARAAAHTALAAAQAVMLGEHAAYALCRPPGHHAAADRAAGFCYLNNAAIAAQSMRQHFARVAILDVDAHHGDGTQWIFYDRADVQFVSIHADPTNYYPYFSGYADEYGAGAGEGFNLNLPLTPGSGDAEFLDSLDDALEAIRVHRSEALVVSVGFDAHERDPLSVLKLTTDGYRRVGDTIAALKLPTVIVQEGGYNLDTLGKNLIAFLGGFNLATRL